MTKGDAFELRVKKYFKGNGYTVFNIIDSNRVVKLIIFPRNTVWMQRPMYIICNDGKEVNEEEKQALYRLAHVNNTVPVVAYENKKGRLKFEIIKLR